MQSYLENADTNSSSASDADLKTEITELGKETVDGH